MEQERIGKFLQELRREKGMTQKELAQEISVSDKTVSKWETGNGLPDVGSLQAISVFFGVSINELLAGERVSAGDYQRKAEETITGLLEQEQKGRKKSWIGMLISFVLLVAGVVLALIWSHGVRFVRSLPMWFDGGTLMALAMIYLALGILFWGKEKRETKDAWKRLEKIIIPIGLIWSLGEVMNVLLTGLWDAGMFVQLAYCVLPVLYAMFAYVLCVFLERENA